MSREYSDCFFCGGAVREQRIGREVWWHGRLHLIEDVPVGVCDQCGEKFIRPDVAKAIDRMLAGDVSPDRIVEVPAYRWPTQEPVS
jgi:YgiT-type zinc finger domain-containing protein